MARAALVEVSRGQEPRLRRTAPRAHEPGFAVPPAPQDLGARWLVAELGRELGERTGKSVVAGELELGCRHERLRARRALASRSDSYLTDLEGPKID
jgi:hypothetical protein